MSAKETALDIVEGRLIVAKDIKRLARSVLAAEALASAVREVNIRCTKKNQIRFTEALEAYEAAREGK